MQSHPEIPPVLKPFIRWAGGKWRFVSTITAVFPPRSLDGTYFEPFLGSGAAFLAYQPPKAVLSDLNGDLIKTFKAVRETPALINRYLQEFGKYESEAFYYKTRGAYNSSRDSYRQAARLIYLNKACFNGIYRVNTRGVFNVPYGYRQSLNLPCLEQLQSISHLLKRATIVHGDYKEVVQAATAGDIVYLDPPYPPLNGTSFFSHYTKERFSSRDQEEVADIANGLSVKRCRVVISNADTAMIRSLYKDWTMMRVQRTRYVTAGLAKHKVHELIIKNY